jgi:hypothetical protein
MTIIKDIPLLFKEGCPPAGGRGGKNTLGTTSLIFVKLQDKFLNPVNTVDNRGRQIQKYPSASGK